MGLKMLILEVIWANHKVITALNNWVVWSVKEKFRIIQISASELGATYSNFTVFTVSKED